MKILLIDNYDSFTYNLFDYLVVNGVTCVISKNDVISIVDIQQGQYAGIVISPGPKRPSDAGITKEVIDNFANKIPILGICLGCQAIGEYFGSTLVKAQKPVHGKASRIEVYNHFLFQGLPSSFNVMRYHSLILNQVMKPLDAIAKTDYGEIMAVSNNNGMLSGLQFHPESIISEHGHTIIRNWIAFVKNCALKI